LFRESFGTILFQAGASDVKMPRLRQHSSNHGMPCFVNVLATLWGTWDQPEQNPGACFWCAVNMFPNFAKCEIQRPGTLIARKIGQLNYVGCTYDSHNCRSGRKLILCTTPQIAHVHLAVESSTLRVSKVHRFQIVVRLKSEMCQKQQDTFDNIPVV